MSLLTQASLVLTPNAYKANKLYSIIPSSGNGDMTTTRATTATRVNANQLVESVATNVPRLNYDANGSASILLEPQRTNSIRNSTMQGANVTTDTIPNFWNESAIGGLTSTVIGLGTENGLSYIDYRLNGTATTNFAQLALEGSSVIAGTVDQNFTFSPYLKVISQPNPPTFYRLLINEFSAAPAVAYLTGGAMAVTPTTTLQRFSYTRQNSNAACASIVPYIAFTLVIGQSYDFTIRIAAPQLELGAYSTSYIPTTTTALTRNADVLSRNNIFTNGLITPSGGTWFYEIDNNFSLIRDAGSNGIFIGDNSNPNNGFRIRAATLSSEKLIIEKVISFTSSLLYTTLTNRIKVAIDWNGTTADIFVNGVKVVTATSFPFLAMQLLSINAIDVPKYIRQIALFPTPLTDAECITLTTL
jgi:hypothetical protein